MKYGTKAKRRRYTDWLKRGVSLGLAAILMASLVGCFKLEPNEPHASGVLYSEDAFTTKSPTPLVKVSYPSPSTGKNEVTPEFVDKVDRFGYDSAAVILTAEGKSANINYSPLSFYYALAVLAPGTDGQTQREILTALNVDSAKELEQQAGALYRDAIFDNETGKLSIANSVWIDDDLDYKKSYVEKVADTLYAESFYMDLGSEESGLKQGKWIADNTEGTLAPKLPVYPALRLRIINTVYFKDSWILPFDEKLTKADVFHVTSGDVEVDFMNLKTSGAVVGSDDYLRGELSFENGGRMVFVLPDEGVSPLSLVSDGDTAYETFCGGKETYTDVIWKMPKFTFNNEFELVDVAQDLGIESAFTERSDLSGISDDPLFVSKITQFTHLRVNEKEVEASAATAIDIAPTSAQPADEPAYMILDRPFLFAIYDTQGALLFIGICNNPAV